MDEKLATQIRNVDLEEVVKFLVDENCFSPVVDALVSILTEKLNKLSKIEEILK